MIAIVRETHTEKERQKERERDRESRYRARRWRDFRGKQEGVEGHTYVSKRANLDGLTLFYYDIMRSFARTVLYH